LTVIDSSNLSSSDTVAISVSRDATRLPHSTAISLSATLSGSKVTATGQVTVRNGTGNLILDAIQRRDGDADGHLRADRRRPIPDQR
jgi:hypothetical protein